MSTLSERKDLQKIILLFVQSAKRCSGPWRGAVNLFQSKDKECLRLAKRQFDVLQF